MSMLSHQADELRSAAKLLNEIGISVGYKDTTSSFIAHDAAERMEEAAHTIESLRNRLQAVGDTCSIEWRGESYDTDAGREHDGAYFCTKCMADLPQPLQECWDDYQALVADYGNVKPWDKKPFLCCPNCGRKVVDE